MANHSDLYNKLYTPCSPRNSKLATPSMAQRLSSCHKPESQNASPRAKPIQLRPIRITSYGAAKALDAITSNEITINSGEVTK